MRRLIIPIMLIGFVGSLATNCDPKSDDSDETLLLGLAVLNSGGGSNSALSTEQQQGSSAANSAASVSSSVSSSANSGGQTAMIEKKHRILASLYGEIVQNGKDPYFIRERVREVEMKSKPMQNKAELAAISFSSNGTQNGKNAYTFSGTTDGIGVTTVAYDIGTYNPYISGSCLVDVKTIDFTNKIGTATISNGNLTYSGSGTGTGFSGTMYQTYTASFNNFGTAWFDMYSYMKAAKEGAFNNVITGGITCATYQAMYGILNSYLRSGVINSGTMNVEYNSTYSNSTTAGYSSNYTSKVTSTDGIVLDGATITMDLTMTTSSSASASSGTYTGSYTITFSGTVNGQSVNDTLTISYP